MLVYLLWVYISYCNWVELHVLEIQYHIIEGGKLIKVMTPYHSVYYTTGVLYKCCIITYLLFDNISRILFQSKW